MSKLLCSLSIVFGLSFSSCSKESEPVVSNPVAEEVQKPLSMQIYAYSMLASMDLIEEFVLESNDPAKEHFRSMGLTYDAQAKLQENLSPLAQRFSKDMGFTRTDYEEILGTPIISQQELESMQLATMMFGVLLEQANDQSLDPTVVAARRGLLDCIGEALGINDLIDVFHAIETKVVNHQVIKSTLKTVLKISGKAAGRWATGIGVGILVVEVAYCMLSGDFVKKYDEDIEYEIEVANLHRMYKNREIPYSLYVEILERMKKDRDERIKQSLGLDRYDSIRLILNEIKD